MATLSPFRALRPRPADAARVAAVPYDVVTTTEARQLASGNALSFLRVSRAEIELPEGVDPYGPEVYARAARNFAELRATTFELEPEPALYGYRLRTGGHQQVGVAGCFAIDEYDRDVIKKHERTRREKEDDRTRHMLAVGAQTGPVLLTYPAESKVDSLMASITAAPPLFDFTAADGVQHTLWAIAGSDRDRLVSAFADIAALYIADGHHRAASASRAKVAMGDSGRPATSLGDGAGADWMLAVAFPDNQMRVLPYHRVVKDLGGRSPDAFLSAVAGAFTVQAGPAAPARRGEIAMFLAGSWYALRPLTAPDAGDPIASLDVSVLQERLLGPILGITDVRTDRRIDFVGGIRGTGELERAVASGEAAVAFSLYPVSVSDLMAVSNAGGIMPPKSTWFEPKLRDGLLIHLI